MLLYRSRSFDGLFFSFDMPSIFIYDKFLIVAFESDTMETSLVHCLEHCYSCYALATIRGSELVIFPGIALKSKDKSIVRLPPVLRT